MFLKYLGILSNLSQSDSDSNNAGGNGGGGNGGGGNDYIRCEEFGVNTQQSVIEMTNQYNIRMFYILKKRF